MPRRPRWGVGGQHELFAGASLNIASSRSGSSLMSSQQCTGRGPVDRFTPIEMGGQLVTPVVEVFVGGDVDGQRSQFRRQRLIDLSEHLTERPPMNADGEHERIRSAFKAPHGLPLDSQQQVTVGIGGSARAWRSSASAATLRRRPPTNSPATPGGPVGDDRRNDRRPWRCRRNAAPARESRPSSGRSSRTDAAGGKTDDPGGHDPGPLRRSITTRSS